MNFQTDISSKQTNLVETLSKNRRRESVSCYLMLALPIIGFLVLSVYPVLWTFRWAFFQYTGIPSDTLFVGVQNFWAIFTRDATYWQAWLNTILFAVIKIPIELALAMLIALALSGRRKGAGLFRSLYYLPSIISVAIIGLIFSNLFSFFGWVNGIFFKLGLIDVGINWFASKWTAFAVLIMGSIWNTFGINVMYFCAALSGVSEDIYEAAQLDGANALTKFFRITLPMIAPVFQIVLLLSMLGTIGTNDYIIALTNGAPGGKTHMVMSYMTTQFVPGFMDAATKPNLGYGCALGIVTTVLFAITAGLHNNLSKKMPSGY